MEKNMSETRNIQTVSQVNEYIKSLIDSIPALNALYVKGEISNFTNHKSGHLYFTLKDEGGVLRTVMFRFAAQKLKFRPENGMKVVCFGRISAFPRDGQYQLYVEEMEPDGIGSLALAFEQLKAKLQAEGLFDPSHKKPLPKIPLRIGIITSPTGAAVRDMINITARRFPFAEIVLYPSLVQGEGAPPQLIAGLDYFNRTNSVNVIIIGRGGGSIEDLWAFNDEGVARAIFASRIPVISAVGHETDFTIADFVADRRAPTPSAAAELAVPETTELKRKINNIVGKNVLQMENIIRQKRENLLKWSERKAIRSPQYLVDEKRMTLLSLEKRLESGEKYTLSQKKSGFVAAASKLEALNPLSIITRGYSAVFREDGTVIKSISQIEKGDTFTFRTSDGSVKGEVLEKYGNE